MTTATQTVTLTAENFEREALKSAEPVLVDFWAPWCPPCRAIAPAIEALAGEFAGRARVGKLDIDAHPEVAAGYGVRSIPTLLIFKDGEVVDRITGAAPREAIAAKLEGAIEGGGARAICEPVHKSPSITIFRRFSS